MLVDLSSFDFDDPLLEAAIEVDSLEDYCAALEDQIDKLQRTHKLCLDAYLKTQELTPDDPEWHEATQEYYRVVDLILPRFFRGPLLVGLYALYETLVLEVAGAIQKLNPQMKRLNSFKKKERLSFLERAAQYYKEVLNLELCHDPSTWQRLITLSKLRHAVAHANGRIESLYPANFKAEIKQIAQDTAGLDARSGYLAFEKEFVAQTASLVLGELRRLIEEHREACRPRKTV